MLECGRCPLGQLCDDRGRCEAVVELGALPQVCHIAPGSPAGEVHIDCPTASVFPVGKYCPDAVDEKHLALDQLAEGLQQALRSACTQRHRFRCTIDGIGFSDPQGFTAAARYTFGSCKGGELVGEAAFEDRNDSRWDRIPDGHAMFGGLRLRAVLTGLGRSFLNLFSGPLDLTKAGGRQERGKKQEPLGRAVKPRRVWLSFGISRVQAEALP